MQRLRLGFLTHLHVGNDAADSYRIALDLFASAEELGYDSGWVAQHHFLNNDARLPSTLTFLAAVAQRTRRINLGTAIVILPLEDPIRVAEDAAVVDTLSGGRLQLGLGTVRRCAHVRRVRPRPRRPPPTLRRGRPDHPRRPGRRPDQRDRGAALPAGPGPDRAPLGVDT